MRKPVGVQKNTKYEPTLLDKWMNEQGLSTYTLGRMVGIDKSCIQAWRTGSGVPTLVAAFRLEEVTRGRVPASSWLATTVGLHMYNQLKEKARGG